MTQRLLTTIDSVTDSLASFSEVKVDKNVFDRSFSASGDKNENMALMAS